MVVPVFTTEHKKRGQFGSQTFSLIKVPGTQQVVQVFDTDALSTRLSA
jgi:hypothetical protein